jgi:hypothetical protein
MALYYFDAMSHSNSVLSFQISNTFREELTIVSDNFRLKSSVTIRQFFHSIDLLSTLTKSPRTFALSTVAAEETKYRTRKDIYRCSQKNFYVVIK